MKTKTIIVVAVTALLFCAGAVVSHAQDLSKIKYPKLNQLQIPDVEKVTLENGMRLYLVEDHSLPTFRVSARINAGDMLEPDDKVGLVSIMCDVLRSGGTEKWTGDKLDEMLEAVGASVETNGGLTSCGARVSCLSEYTDLGLEVLAQVLRHPVMDQDKIDLAKVQERSSIARRNDDAFGICIREFRKQISGPNSVYARTTEYATIDAITRDDLMTFHDTYFRPENVQMAVWGDFDKDEIVAKFIEYFGDWAPGSPPIPKPPEVNYEWRNKVYYIEKNDVNQSSILIGHIGGWNMDPDYPDRIVMNNVLGAGNSGRMYNKVRTEMGLAYQAEASYTSNFSYPGFFYALTLTKSETTLQAIKAAREVIASMLTEPPDEWELKKAKDSYLNSFVFNFDSKSEVVTRLMNYDYLGVPEDFLQKTKERVENVTADDVIAAARKNLHPDELLVIVVGKGEDFDGPLTDLDMGPVDTIDITIPTAEEKRELAITPENLERGSELLAEATKALGGMKNFSQVKSVKSKGTFTMVMQGQEIPLQFESISVLPDKDNTVISFMGRKMYDVRGGDTGWKTDQTTGGIAPKTEDDIANDEKEQRRSNLYIFKHSADPSCRAVYDGSGEGVDYVVILDDNDEAIARLSLDAGTHELVGKSYWGQTMAGEGTIEETYDDWKSVAGVKLPMLITRTMNGQKVGTMAYTEFDANVQVPDDAFTKPSE